MRLVAAGTEEQDEVVAGLGKAWPDPPELGALLAPQKARPLHAVLRDQRVIAGIGRSWVDEILWTARLSPFKRAGDLRPEEATALRDAVVGRLGEALAHAKEVVRLPIPDKLPLPLLVHRHGGEPCPALRHDPGGRPLQVVRAGLLPAGADGRTGAQGPEVVAVAEVGRFVSWCGRIAARARRRR